MPGAPRSAIAGGPARKGQEKVLSKVPEKAKEGERNNRFFFFFFKGMVVWEKGHIGPGSRRSTIWWCL